MVYSPAFSFANSPLSFYFIRSFTHLFVLFCLIAHQLLFHNFVDPYLSVSLYSVCFLVLFIDSLGLFFYREEQQNISLYLFLDALFLSALVVVMGLPWLFFVFVLIFAQTFSLFICGKILPSFMFLLYLSVLFPMAFLWEGNFSFEDRLSLAVLIQMTLFSIFCFGWLFTLFLKLFEDRKKKQDAGLNDVMSLKPSAHIGLSLDLSRKLKPVLNSLIKYFPENTKNKDQKYSVSPSFFSPKKGRDQLRQMRQFILDFIEYAEPETESLLEDIIDLKELVRKSLKKLETHFHRPENLIQKVDLPMELKAKGSAVHLEKCFEHILVNSFEALRNQNQPEIHIRGFLGKSWVELEFSDNGQGIESEDMNKLFNPLFSKRFGFRGGLGLPYVQKIVKAHKAELHIKSSQKGTKILIKFPLVYDFYKDPLKNLFLKKNRTKVA